MSKPPSPPRTSDEIVSELLPSHDTSLLRDVFIRIDTDGDGFVSVRDILRFFAREGHRPPTQSEKLVRSFFELADTDKDGTLDVFDFLAAHVSGCPGLIPASLVARVASSVRNTLSDNDLDELQIAFRVFDVDGDGQLSEQELAALLRCEAALRNVHQRRRRHRARVLSASSSTTSGNLAASASTVFSMASASSSETATGAAVDDATIAWILARAARGFVSSKQAGAAGGSGGAEQQFNLSSFIRVAQESEILLPDAAACTVPLAVKIRRCYEEADALHQQHQDEGEQQQQQKQNTKKKQSTVAAGFVHLMRVAAGPHATAEHHAQPLDRASERARRMDETADILCEEMLSELSDAATIARLLAEALVREIELLGADWEESGISVLDGLQRNYPDESIADGEAGANINFDGSLDTSASSSSAWLSSMWVALRIFDSLDVHGKQRLGPSELAFLVSAPHFLDEQELQSHQQPQQQQHKKKPLSALGLIARYDLDGDGALNFAEFLAALSSAPVPLIPRDRIEACELYLGMLASSVQASALARVLATFSSDPVEFAAALDAHLDVVDGMLPVAKQQQQEQEEDEHDLSGVSASDAQQPQRQQQHGFDAYEIKQRLQRCYTRDTILLLATEGFIDVGEQKLAIAAFKQLLRSDATVLMQFATLLTTKVLSIPNVILQRSRHPQQQQQQQPQVTHLQTTPTGISALCSGSLLSNIFPRTPSSPQQQQVDPLASPRWDSVLFGTPASPSLGGPFSAAAPPSETLVRSFHLLDANRHAALDPEVVVPIAVKRLASNRFDLRVVHRVIAALFRALDRDHDDRLSLSELSTAVSGPLILFTELDISAAAARLKQREEHNMTMPAARQQQEQQAQQQQQQQRVAGIEDASSSASDDNIIPDSPKRPEQRVHHHHHHHVIPLQQRVAQSPAPPQPQPQPSSQLQTPTTVSIIRPSSCASTGSHHSAGDTPEPRGLPQSDIGYINNLFHALDAKRDGFIDLGEMLAAPTGPLSRLLGESLSKWTPAQREEAAKKFIEAGDLDGDGVLSQKDFLSCFIRGLVHVPSSAKRRDSNTIIKKSEQTAGADSAAQDDIASTNNNNNNNNNNSNSYSSSSNATASVKTKNRSISPSSIGRAQRQQQQQQQQQSLDDDGKREKKERRGKNTLVRRLSSPTLSFAASNESPEKVETLRYLFSYIDRNRNGLISKEELRQLLKEFIDTHFQNDPARLSQFTDEMMLEISGADEGGGGKEQEFTFEQFVAAFERNPDLMRVSADAVRVRIQRTEDELERLMREEDLRRIAKVFVSLDSDGNGVLDFDEVHDELFELIKHQYPDWSNVDIERTVRSIFETADINSDGSLSFDEFMATFVNKHYSLTGFIDSRAARFRRDLTAEEVAELKSLFSFMDENSDGSVSAEELSNLVASALSDTANDDPATIAAIVDSVLAIADTNRDGSVDLREFIAAYQQDSQLLDIPIMAAAARRDAAEKKMQALLCKHDLRDIAKVFLMIDKNGDGEISKTELEEELSAQLRRLHRDWPESKVYETIATVFEAAEWSSDTGTLSLDAFIESFVQGHYLLPPGSLQDVVATFTRKLSSEEVGQLVNLFNKIDVNADGTISKNELEQALEEAVGRDTAEAVSKVVMTVADENGDGVLSISEFLKCYQLDNGLLTVPISGMSVTTLQHVAERILPKQAIRRLGRMFALLAGSDGFVGVAELAAGLRRYQRSESSFSAMSASAFEAAYKKLEDVARAKILSADLDGDGKLSLDEWMASYANAGCDAAVIMPWSVIDNECSSPARPGTPIMSPGGAAAGRRESTVLKAQIARLSRGEDADEDDGELHKSAERALTETQAAAVVAAEKRRQLAPAATAPVVARPASATKPMPPPRRPVSSAASGGASPPPHTARAGRYKASQHSASPGAGMVIRSTDQNEIQRLFELLTPEVMPGEDEAVGRQTVDVKKAKVMYRDMESFGLTPSSREIDMLFGPVTRPGGRIGIDGFSLVMLRRLAL